MVASEGRCEACSELYPVPPCGDCEHGDPPPLRAANLGVWGLWSTAHQHGRDGMNGALQLGPLLELARLRRLPPGDVERALALEGILAPHRKRASDGNG